MKSLRIVKNDEVFMKKYILLLTISAGILIYFGYNYFIDKALGTDINQQSITFDRKKWDDDINQRYPMAKKLIEDNELIGKTKDEVIQLLGQKHLVAQSDLSLSYIAGENYVDPWILEIYFDESGHANKAFIRDG